MLTLFFLVVGEGSVFPVKIDEGESVGVLKEEIKKKKKLFDKYDSLFIWQKGMEILIQQHSYVRKMMLMLNSLKRRFQYIYQTST
jgi:hypothetical protein